MNYVCSLCLYLFAGISLIAQNVSVKIKSMESDDPVSGASIFINKQLYAISDSWGRFEIDTSKVSISDSLEMSHVAFLNERAIISDLLKQMTISLSPKLYVLDEVEVCDGVVPTEIRQAKKNFRKNQIINDWCDLSLGQAIFYDDALQGYLELDGKIHMVDDSDGNPFKLGFIMPNHVRYIPDSEELLKIMKSDISRKGMNSYSFFAWEEVALLLNMYRMAHPFSTDLNRVLEFQLAKENEDDMLAFDFYQTTKLKIKTRFLNNMYGKIWIDSSDYSLRKVSIYFDFENLSSCHFLIEYDTSGEFTFISSAKAKIYRKVKGQKEPIVIASDLIMTNPQYLLRPKRLDRFVIVPLFVVGKDYDYQADYWANRPIIVDEVSAQEYKFQGVYSKEVYDSLHVGYPIYKQCSINCEAILKIIEAELE